MNSPFANIYLALINRINTLLTDGDNPEKKIRYIDLDYNQLEYERPAVSYPAVLINFQNWQYSNQSNLIQMAEGTVVIKLATAPVSSTSGITPDTYKESALSILDLECNLYTLLHGFKAATQYDPNDPEIVTRQTTPFIRIASISDNRRVGLKVIEITFKTSFTDLSASTLPTLTPKPQINIQPSFNLPT